MRQGARAETTNRLLSIERCDQVRRGCNSSVTSQPRAGADECRRDQPSRRDLAIVRAAISRDHPVVARA